MYGVKIFYSYARRDKRLRDELDKHLEPMKRLGQITTWHDREIQPGANWKKEIEDQLDTADIVLVLLSPNFVSSDYCYGQEMQRVLARHAAGEILIIPIILRPVSWKELPIGNLQALPTDAKPISSWRSRDEAFEDVVQGIQQVVMNYLLRKTNKDYTQQMKGNSQQLNLLTKPLFMGISHVLRTPLTAVGGYLELLDLYGEQLDKTDAHRFTNNALHAYYEIVPAVDWLNELLFIQSQLTLEEILLTKAVRKAIVAAHVKIERGMKTYAHLPEELALKMLAEEILQIRGYPLSLDFPKGLWVKTDVDFLSCILCNILSNIWKYTPIGTPVSVQARLAENVDNEIVSSVSSVVICIKDYGPGIPPDELPKLFEPFYRLERDLIGKTNGLGLGLYVSKQLVEALDGHMWVESMGVPGEGSCFYFTLPNCRIGDEADDQI